MIYNVLEYLEYDALHFPGKTAVTDERKSLCYREVHAFSRRIGTAIARKTEMRRPVAVLMEKNADTLCTFFGIVQAGCFYVLLNPQLPRQRLAQILSVLQAQLLVTDPDHKDLAHDLLPPDRGEVLLFGDLLAAEEDTALLESIRSRAIDTDPLYTNFTSGSSGVPKGVAVSHRSVLDFIEVFVPLFSISETDIIGSQAPFDFDVSVKDIYSALKTAATLVLIPRQLFSQPAALVDFLCDHSVTTMIWAVSALCLLSTFHGLEYRTPASVRRVLFSGEKMPLKHLNYWMEHLPDAEFVNLYGPTEITCNCTYHRIQKDRDYSAGIPIGKAFPNEHVFLLDENNREITNPGETGEICVRGCALALGYYANRQQTDAAFQDNPLNPWYPEKIYRTGDLGKYNGQGELMFTGRRDFQIKYMGHRIELEEIENAIASVPEVDRCCVIFSEKRQKLYGFYTGSMDRKTLHAALKQTLPPYMIPGSLKQISAFPLTKNGKIDRTQLMEEYRP